ncbi:MAG: methyltransferase [Pseudomonadota bacterium]
MIDARLSLAFASGALSLPSDGRIAVFNPPKDASLPGTEPARTTIVEDFKPDYDHWQARGFEVATEACGEYSATVVCLPRAKAEARVTIALAMAVTSGPVIIDGQKTDGADSLLRDVRRRVNVSGPIVKAHGKLFWTQADSDLFADWVAGPALTSGGFWTAPGVFSADGIDPASSLLASALPDRLGPRIADLGAGWGFLSAHILTRAEVEEVHLVEARHMALQCARRNVTDPRAIYHWADVVKWRPDVPLDTIVMNPPFHAGRAAEPALGKAFIAAAAACLSSRGDLWMVANRHLPYETALSEQFAEALTIGEDHRFKLFCASRPKRKKS